MQKKDYFRLLISIILAVIGILTIFSPANAMFAVVLILGIIFVIWGAVIIIREFNARSKKAASLDEGQTKNKKSLPVWVRIILAALLLAAGILLLVFSTPAKDVFMPVIIGFWALVTGIFATINAVGFKKKNMGALLSIIALVVSYVTFICLLAFSFSDPGFTASPAGGIFLLIFGLITAMEIAISSRQKNAGSSKKVN